MVFVGQQQKHANWFVMYETIKGILSAGRIGTLQKWRLESMGKSQEKEVNELMKKTIKNKEIYELNYVGYSHK